MIRCLLNIKHSVVEEAKSELKEHLSQDQIQYYKDISQTILQKGYQANPLKNLPDGNRTRGRPKKGKARCLLERINEHQEKVLAFMTDFEIPFDNNLAERDFRWPKCDRKFPELFALKKWPMPFAGSVLLYPPSANEHSTS